MSLQTLDVQSFYVEAAETRKQGFQNIATAIQTSKMSWKYVV